MRDWSKYEKVLLWRREGWTLKRCAQELGRSHERIRQMEAVAVRFMIRGEPALQHLLPLTEREANLAQRYSPISLAKH